MTSTARRYLFWSATCILIVIATMACVAWSQIQGVTHATASNWLQTGLRVGELVRNEDLRDIGARSERLAANQAFVGYVSQALDAGSAPGGTLDLASASDLLSERKTEYGFDLIAILDLNGRIIVGGGYVLQPQRDLSSNAVVSRARKSLAPATGSWTDEGGVHLISVVPLLRGDSVTALMLTGMTVGHSFVTRIAEASATDVAIVILPPTGPLVVASTLAPAQAQQLKDALLRFPAPSQADPIPLVSVHIDDRDQLAAAAPTFDSADTVMISLIPAHRAGGFVRAITLPLAAGSAVILMAGLIGLMVLWRTWFAPLLRLLRAAEFASRGDFSKDADVVGTGPIAQLGVTTNVLMMKLRRHARATLPAASTTKKAS